MTETIERMKFTHLAVPDQREELAKNAMQVLGYKKLALALIIPDALLFALRKLDIEPLAPSGVGAYKQRKATPGMWSGHKKGLRILAFAASLFFGIAPGLNQYAHWEPGPTLAAIGVIMSLIAGVIFSIIGLMHLLDRDFRGERVTRGWKEVELVDYAGTVPEFVLAKALQIKEEVPGVKFQVEVLTESSERIVRPLRDPFLVASLKNERYYIDVWEEKEYEARM